MKHLPNLLKQETSSAETLVIVLVQMYYDTRSEHQALRPQVADKLLPCVFLHCDIIRILNSFVKTGSRCYSRL